MRASWLLLLALACRTPGDKDGVVPDESAPPDTHTGAPDDTGVPRTALADHVVVLVLDGLRLSESFGEGVSDAAGTPTSEILPELRARLLPEGTLVRHGYVTGIPITGPGHCDLITGVRHEFGHFPTPVGAGGYRPLFPTLYEQLAGSGAPLVLSGNTDHVESLNRSVYPGVTDDDGAVYTLTSVEGDLTRPEPRDTTVIEAVKAQLAADKPRLMITNLHAIDLAGHVATDPATYVARARDVDGPIADLWAWIESAESGLAGRTALVLVSDHGRHYWGPDAAERLEELDPPDYRHHGDQCGGCRQIPMFLAGPGIAPGATVEGPYTLEDVSRTIAYMLGADLPYGTGVVMRDLFTDPPAEDDRSGVYEVDTSGSAVATWSWLDEGGHRSRVEVDGEVVSSPGAFAAEAPRVVEAGPVTYACWREFTIQDESVIDWPWAAECHARTAGVWTDLEFPLGTVSSLWKPALGVDAAGRLVVAFVDNPNSTTYSEDRAFLKVYRWSAAGWEFVAEPGIGTGFPGAPSVVVEGDTAWVAWSESDMSDSNGDNLSGRYTRHVEVARFGLGADGLQVAREVWRTSVDTCPAGAGCDDRAPTVDVEGRAYTRMESPAILVDGPTIRVAWIAWDTDGSHLLWATSTDTGDTWSTPERVDATGKVYGHLAPRWADGKLYWSRLGAVEAEACRVAPGGEPTCVALGSARVTSLAPTATNAWVTVDTGEGAWASQEVVW
ncbi:MAG: alkaline phosphatase family protein [Pseudomonadota bacterium]|nr:alkaline phosphatase family protein [Pseudomonadota bacterium]